MADVRCPMCGKSTPAGQESCRHCGARLKPVWESKPESHPDADVPDWLRSLGSETPASGQTAPAKADASAPDWLSGLRDQGENSASEGPGGEDSDLGGEEDDWLARIGAGSSAASPKPAKGPERKPTAEDLRPNEVDWLAGSAAELPDWLKSSEGGEASGAEPDNDTFDWGAGGDQGLPDWLQTGTPQKNTPAGKVEKPPEPVKNDLPDWLPGSGAPDWLKSESLPEVAAGTAAGETQAPDEAGLPDWLSGAGNELPDWLHSEPPAQGTPKAPQAAPGAETASSGNELPDWLESEPKPEPKPSGTGLLGRLAPPQTSPQGVPASGTPAKPPVTKTAGSGEAEEGEMPDWLLQAHEEPPAGTAEVFTYSEPGSEKPAERSEQDADLSAWLATLTPGAKDTGRSGTSKKTPASAASPQASEETSDLSWLDDLEGSYSGLTVESDQSEAGYGTLAVGSADEQEIASGDDLPAWLAAATAGEERPAAKKEAQPWLPVAAEKGQPAGPVPGQETSGLNLAELPSWLEAMRPVGSAAGSPEKPGGGEPEQVEGAGPLAGLHGVLPAEPDISQAEKPPVYSVRLNVSDTQETQARTLSDLIAAEVQPAKLATGPAVTSKSVLRVAVAALLLLTLLAQMVANVVYFDPQQPSEDVKAARDLVDGLPAGSHVLFAVDYQPGFSAEMDALSDEVLTHLFSKGIVPVFLSTTPTGAIQAERLVRKIAAETQQSLSANSQYVNRGFLPGGEVGLASFFQPPTGIAPSIGDFDYKMILVATESPERAREWIQQIRSPAGSAPVASANILVVMIVSAQADPLVRSYYAANPRQVQALVSGLSGAVMYESGRAQAGAAARYWSPYNLGLILAAVLMIFTSLYSLITGQLELRRSKRQAVIPAAATPGSEGKTA